MYAVHGRHDHVHDDDLRLQPAGGAYGRFAVRGQPYHLDAVRRLQASSKPCVIIGWSSNTMTPIFSTDDIPGSSSGCFARNHAGDGGPVPVPRVDSGRGWDRTQRGMAPIECAIDGWS